MKTDWDRFRKQVKEREEKLKDSLEKALKYREQVETLRPWIDRCQHSLDGVTFSLDPTESESSIAELKSLQKEMDHHFGMLELLNNTANSLLSVCEVDKEAVTEENQSLMEKAQQKSLQTLKQQVDEAKRLAQDLVVEAADSKGTSDVLLQAETLAEEHSELSQQVDEKCSFLETKLQGLGHFQNTIREMFSQFTECDDELDGMAPVGRDAETLRKQKACMQTFLKKLEALMASNDSANRTCKMMLATEETSPDLIGVKRDLEALSKQCNKLLDRAKTREEQVDGATEKLEEFHRKLEEFSTLLQKAEEHEESQGPVGTETETINQQLDVFKILRFQAVLG